MRIERGLELLDWGVQRGWGLGLPCLFFVGGGFGSWLLDLVVLGANGMGETLKEKLGDGGSLIVDVLAGTGRRST